MQVGIITVDGRQVGVVSQTEGDVVDTFTPDLEGYEPQGRASETPQGGTKEPAPAPHHGYHHHGGRHREPGHHEHRQRRREPEKPRMRFGGEGDTDPVSPQRQGYQPRGEEYRGERGHPVHQGSAEVDRAIVEAARAHNLDPNFMRSIASIESGMNPSSNANRSTQYKGLFQMGSRGPKSEWARFGGGGNIYSAQDNAMAAARYFDANRTVFRQHYHRDPTDTEMYMMHQQGLGFYTRGAMTNIRGNPYPGMRGAQSHETFEEGWGREVARRKAGYAARSKPEVKAEETPPKPFDPETDPL
ncbi:hypothetical protein [Bradyrhizobium lablabi]|uniref:hypothetical protein n=1 Tax=Bradyrhizobium lablabi TaxID=722472 RepID=UPI001BAB3EDB|nr:hypothetical protein [Bradyrhizobium lablabi]MBR0693677.1 hypothetical protein [Bradyrhizobium lablabi]